MEIGGEEVRDGGVEGVNGDVLENEGRLGGTENCPYDENNEEDDEEEDQNAGEKPPEDFSSLAFVVVALFYRHG